jgi:hypothetical protein
MNIVNVPSGRENAFTLYWVTPALRALREPLVPERPLL